MRYKNYKNKRRIYKKRRIYENYKSRAQHNRIFAKKPLYGKGKSKTKKVAHAVNTRVLTKRAYSTAITQNFKYKKFQLTSKIRKPLNVKYFPKNVRTRSKKCLKKNVYNSQYLYKNKNKKNKKLQYFTVKTTIPNSSHLNKKNLLDKESQKGTRPITITFLTLFQVYKKLLIKS